MRQKLRKKNLANKIFFHQTKKKKRTEREKIIAFVNIFSKNFPILGRWMWKEKFFSWKSLISKEETFLKGFSKSLVKKKNLVKYSKPVKLHPKLFHLPASRALKRFWSSTILIKGSKTPAASRKPLNLPEILIYCRWNTMESFEKSTKTVN